MAMEDAKTIERETWGSPLEFLLSCIAMSVGLGTEISIVIRRIFQVMTWVCNLFQRRQCLAFPLHGVQKWRWCLPHPLHHCAALHWQAIVFSGNGHGSILQLWICQGLGDCSHS